MNGEPMKKLSIIFLLLTGCATAQPGTDPQTRIQEITFAGLVKFENETPTNCQSPDLKMSLRTAAYLTTQADILRTRQLTAGLILEIGDRALKKGLLGFCRGSVSHRHCHVYGVWIRGAPSARRDWATRYSGRALRQIGEDTAMKLFALLFALTLPGCTTIPSRFTQNESIYPNCGYVIEPLGDGFALEIFLKEFSLSASADGAIRKGRECYTKTATALAQGQGKRIAPVTVADMNTSTTSNIHNGYFSVYVTGRVSYEK